MICVAEDASTSYADVQDASQDAGPAKQRLSQRQTCLASQSVEQQQSPQPSQSHSIHKEQQHSHAANSQGLASPCHQSTAAAQLPPSDVIPDTPGACHASSQDMQSGHAQADLQDAAAKRQSEGVISVEADASAVQAVSAQLAELELSPLKQLLKLCGQNVSDALHQAVSLCCANMLALQS